MNKKSIKINELYSCQVPYLKETFENYQYPWELLPLIKTLTKELIEKGIEGYTLLREGILVGQNVTIADTATILPPAVIGEGTEIRPGAYLRGNVITGKNCVIGNSSEIKNSILLDKVDVPHYNYVGDSVLGNHAHMGAGSILSNLKSDGKNVVIHFDTEIETGLRKIGSFLGDGADIGCGCVLNPGTIVGKNTSVYPLTPLRGVYPENSIIKDKNTVVDRI